MSSLHEEKAQLNLARKWRSATFEEIIGQELSINILKNSLYLNSFFPVYLFSGNRGCGKTTTARVFAAAINCNSLAAFQENPSTNTIPCHTCNSCISFLSGSHPDFIEIDAASNTGVDNVRQIIESSTFLPLMGRKKIYLIDEAHMLSKAAFNAFLKVLEEPPAGVLFILATTDIQKIIDTVRSRSFQLFFGHIGRDTLVSHLSRICEAEGIRYDNDGLVIIAREAEGSARDAINMLERVRFSGDAVTQENVLRSLGYMSDEYLIHLIGILCGNSSLDKLVRFIETSNFHTFSPDFMWQRLLELLILSLRMMVGVSINLPQSTFQELEKVIGEIDRLELVRVLDAFCASEALFLKTRVKHVFLEALFIRIISKFENVTIRSEHRVNSIAQNPKIISPKEAQKEKRNDAPQSVSKAITQEEKNIKKVAVIKQPESNDERWRLFLVSIEQLDDPLVKSIFSQSLFKHYDEVAESVFVSFSPKFVFFNDLLADTRSEWHNHLKKAFGLRAKLNSSFDVIEEQTKTADVEVRMVQKVPSSEAQKVSGVIPENQYQSNNAQEKRSDLGEKSHLLLRHFSGNITEIEPKKQNLKK